MLPVLLLLLCADCSSSESSLGSPRDAVLWETIAECQVSIAIDPEGPLPPVSDILAHRQPKVKTQYSSSPVPLCLVSSRDVLVCFFMPCLVSSLDVLACFVVPCLVLSRDVRLVLSCLEFCLVMSWLLSCLVLCRLVMSGLFFHALNFVSSCPGLFYHALPCFVWSIPGLFCHALFGVVMSWLILSCLVWFRHVLACFVMPCFVSSYPGLFCHALSSAVPSCFAFLLHLRPQKIESDKQTSVWSCWVLLVLSRLGYMSCLAGFIT